MNTFFKYWLNTCKYWLNTCKYWLNTCKYCHNTRNYWQLILIVGGSIGDCDNDKFSVSNPSGPGTPVICGTNTNQHMFVDVGGTDCLTVNFQFGADSATRSYSVKVSISWQSWLILHCRLEKYLTSEKLSKKIEDVILTSVAHWFEKLVISSFLSCV